MGEFETHAQMADELLEGTGGLADIPDHTLRFRFQRSGSAHGWRHVRARQLLFLEELMLRDPSGSLIFWNTHNDVGERSGPDPKETYGYRI